MYQMKSEEFLAKLSYAKNKDGYIRISPDHPIDVFIGYDSKGDVTLIIEDSKGSITKTSSTELIEAEIKTANYDKQYFILSLKDKSELDLFILVCLDIINYTKCIKRPSTIDISINRWAKWVNLFRKRKDKLLNKEEIIGLIGELHFLDNLISRIGVDNSVLSWDGPNKDHKDFRYVEKWYEIKTIFAESEVVQINSLEQLNDRNKGYLVINKYCKKNNTSTNYITLNSMIDKILGKIVNQDIALLFLDKLADTGYFRSLDYDNIKIQIEETKYYVIDKKFPIIRRTMIPKSVDNASFSLLLDKLLSFEVKTYETD